MNCDLLPGNAFIDPTGGNIHEVRSLIQSILDALLSHAASASQRPPLPGMIRISSAGIPEVGWSEQALLEKVKEVLDYSMNPAHPGYIGHMDSIPTLLSSLGDFVSSLLNNNMLSMEMSPVFSQMEVTLIQEIAQLFGLGQEAGGVLLSGGTLDNLQALAVARNHAFPILQNGLTALHVQPVLFASEAAHTSLQKAAMLLGLGTSAVVSIKTNANSQMDAADLEKKIHQALIEGKNPFCIVCTAGTTVTGNIDPILEVSKLAKKHKLWLHVDAAYGGAMIFSQKYRTRLAGIETADSITFNPQKWMYVAKTCAMVLFKNRDLLQNNFRISAPYMNDTDEFTNLGEISVQGTRHADILKLWLSLYQIGRKGYEQLINEGCDLANYFAEQVKIRPFIEIASITDTNLCCFRGVPSHIPPEQWDSWNFDLQQYLLKEEEIFLSFPAYRGNRWLRAVLLNPYTTRKTIERIVEAIDRFYCRSYYGGNSNAKNRICR